MKDRTFAAGTECVSLYWPVSKQVSKLKLTQAQADSSQVYFEIIADELEESFAISQNAVDIEDPTFISKIINKVEISTDTTYSSEVKNNLNKVLSNTIPLLKVYPNKITTSAVQSFVFVTMQNDIQDASSMESNSSTKISKYENNIFDYIATDQGIDEKTINPNYNNVPIIESLDNFSAEENQTDIGSITASDLDGNSLIYFISGSEINISNTGVLTFAEAPDYETKNSYSAIVTVSDGTDSVTQNISVLITDVYEPPPNGEPTIDSSGTFNFVLENQTSIGSISASDPQGDSLIYSISGSEINISNTGVLTFAEAPDYETKNSYSATVTVSDGTNSVTQNIVIHLADENDNQHILTLPDVLYGSENSTGIYLNNDFVPNNNQQVVEVADFVDDLDEFDGYYYTITDGDIKVNYSWGTLYFNFTPNYEAGPTEYTATVTAHDSDEIFTASKNITVKIVDINETPTITSSATFNDIAENQTAIGSISVSDPENDSITYSITGSEINISSSGVLTFATAPDYETKNSYTQIVTVSDGQFSVQQQIFVNILNVNEPPIFTSSSIFAVNENETNIGWVEAIDPDAGQNFSSHTWSITGDAGVFIAQDLGVARWGKLTFNPAPDYETKSSYQATVSISDGVNTSSQDITINILDVND